MSRINYHDEYTRATITNIVNALYGFIYEGYPDEADAVAERVYYWLVDNAPDEIASYYDQGGYPSDAAIMEALDALGLLAAAGDEDE